MKEKKDMAYKINDPRPMREAAPFTFHLPPQEDIDALIPGDHVKIAFEDVKSGQVERMWVLVTGHGDGDTLKGALANSPAGIAGLRHGDEIVFERHHAMGIEPKEPRATQRQTAREYWERANVDERVLAGSPVFAMTRLKPMGPDHHGVPDTGWFISAGPLSEATLSQRVAIGLALNSDASFLPYIDLPVGTELQREGGRYVQGRTVQGRFVPNTIQ